MWRYGTCSLSQSYWALHFLHKLFFFSTILLFGETPVNVLAMNSLTLFLSEVAQCVRVDDRLGLVRVLLIDPAANRHIVALNNVAVDDKALNRAVDQQHYYNDEWFAFNEVVVSFVKFARDLDPWSVLVSYDLYTTYMNDLSIAFNNSQRGHLLTAVVKLTLSILLPISVRLDCQLYTKEHCLQPRLAYMASLLLKMFNNIRSQLAMANTLGANDKKAIILFIGYKLCDLYFRLDNPLLCQNIFANMNNANLQMDSFDMNEQIQYRFHLAKFYLIKAQFADAYLHFSWCLRVITNTQGLIYHKNVTVILKYFIPVSILMGKRPNFNFLHHTYYSGPVPMPLFIPIYQQIYTAICTGNYASFVSQLSQPETYHFLKKNGLLIAMSQKCLILVVRNLIKPIWSILNKPLRLDFDVIRRALEMSFGPNNSQKEPLDMFTFLLEPVTDSTVENLLVTLVDQNLLKGKLFLNQRAIALAKNNVFPPVDTIYFVRFGNGLENKLNHNDKWMGNN